MGGIPTDEGGYAIRFGPQAGVLTDYSFYQGEPDGGPDVRLNDLLREAFEHGLQVASRGLSVAPFLLTRGEVEPGVVNMAQHTLKTYGGLLPEDALKKAKQEANMLPSTVALCAIGYHGTSQSSGKRRDAVVVVAEVRGAGRAVKYAWAYRRKGLLTSFKTLGGQIYCGEEDSLLA
jgi:hypothetical protein